MNIPPSIFKLKGLSFVKKLLQYEQERFDNEFLRGSVYEDINLQFGPFPKTNVYPVYFTGDLKHPKGKTIFIGINPGYNQERNREEQKYLQKHGLFDGYCHIFSKYFKKHSQGLSSRYYANVAGFLKRYKNIRKIDWDWLQDNLINLELIPYHSVAAGGIRINDLRHYHRRYFLPLLKILDYIQPQGPIFINGFPSFSQYCEQPPLNTLITFNKIHNFWTGRINKKYDFIGLPFLTRVAGGKDNLVSNIKNFVK